MKNYIKKVKRYISRAYKKITFSSKNYWETRYKTGGNSGSGSYDEIAKFKAEIINDFIFNNRIKSVLDLGCGDGNQIKYFKIDDYVGFDVSKTAIEICKEKYKHDIKKKFFLFENKKYFEVINQFKPELSLSLDVIYHLVEDDVFEQYIHDLFYGANKFVIIFSTNFDKTEDIHHRNRKFTDFIDKNIYGWKLEKVIINPFKGPLTNADFFVYKKLNNINLI